MTHFNTSILYIQCYIQLFFYRGGLELIIWVFLLSSSVCFYTFINGSWFLWFLSEIRRQNANTVVQQESPEVPRQFQLDPNFIVDFPEAIMPELLVVETAESSPLDVPEFKYK